MCKMQRIVSASASDFSLNSFSALKYAAASRCAASAADAKRMMRELFRISNKLSDKMLKRPISILGYATTGVMASSEITLRRMNVSN